LLSSSEILRDSTNLVKRKATSFLDISNRSSFKKIRKFEDDRGSNAENSILEHSSLIPPLKKYHSLEYSHVLTS
jgi:hypothetical protein